MPLINLEKIDSGKKKIMSIAESNQTPSNKMEKFFEIPN